MRICFVLPGESRSGGTRVTVVMANVLRDRGHQVRVACRRDQSRGFLRRVARKLERKLLGNGGWLEHFRGEVVPYSDLTTVPMAAQELVIAVGSQTVLDVARLDARIHKVRYCHGFNDEDQALMEQAWSVPMPTISVSETLLGRLQDLCPGGILGVVPNGIDLDEYHEEGLPRDGIGCVYSGRWKKAPDQTIAMYQRIGARWPHLRRHVFGADRCPTGIRRQDYRRLPSVQVARSLYNRSLIWFVTSRSEGFCLPILEAMACGTPVVSTDHDSVRGLVNPGVNGVLVPVDDPEAMETAIASLVDDAPRREALAEAGRATANRFDWNSAAQKLEGLLGRFGDVPGNQACVATHLPTGNRGDLAG